jgi:hypothetical protein
MNTDNKQQAMRMHRHRYPNCAEHFAEKKRKRDLKVARRTMSNEQIEQLLCGDSTTPLPKTESTTPLPKTESTTPAPKSERGVTIYKLIRVSTGECRYTGKTTDLRRRESEHKSRRSGCRLVTREIRRFGREDFRLEAIMRCSAEEGDKYESYWILRNNTMYPSGLNLRHGSRAGEDEVSLALVSCEVVPFAGVSDRIRAESEGWNDVADMLEESPAEEAVDEMCLELLRKYHPDRCSESIPPSEFAACMNAIRERLIA